MESKDLEQLIKVHKSINRIAKAAGVSYTTIRYWLKRHGLKTEGIPFGKRPRKSKPLCEECGQPVKRRPNVYCSVACMLRLKRRIQVETDPNSVGLPRLKNYLLDTRGHRCEVCGITEWMGRPAPLELDHCDGNSLNNHLDNVRLICPNCHAQTATYKGKNMGSGRYYRRERYATGRSY
jgi:HNH endonuclease.